MRDQHDLAARAALPPRVYLLRRSERPRGLPTYGLPTLPRDGQASHLLSPWSGQAIGQAPMWRVHGTTSTRRCAVTLTLPFPVTLAQHAGVAGGVVDARVVGL